MSLDISLWGAFVAGILSFLSPCVLPLVPPYLCYMSGVNIADLKKGFVVGDIIGSKSQLRKVVFSSIAFILGFTTVFVSIGATASEFGLLLNKYREQLLLVAGIIIILMGLNFLGLLRISLFSREARFNFSTSSSGILNSYVMGVSFSLGWTPCIGPILGTILTIASQKQSLQEGVILLTAYSLGMGVPFLLAALFSRWFMLFLAKFKVNLGYLEKFIGVLLILIGILFINNKVSMLSNIIVDLF